MKACLVAVAGFISIAWAANAAPLSSSATRTSPQDLEVFDIGPDGKPGASRFYTYEQLETLPQATVQTKEDPDTHKPATYTGVYLRDLFSALGAKPGQDVIGSNCYDKYKDYYDPSYIKNHQPMFLLKYNGKPPAEWPLADGTMTMGPYNIVDANFVPAEKIYGYAEIDRIPFGVISLELTTMKQAFASFTPKKNGDDPEVIKGQRIAMGSCVMCHNTEVSGGEKANRPWSILAIFATSNGDYFRNYVVNPKKYRADTQMTDHPTFDAKTLDALQAYFKTME